MNTYNHEDYISIRLASPDSLAWLLLLLCYLAVPDGRAANPMVVPQKGSTPETIVSQARLSLAEARKTQSDPKTAVGHYLEAADAAVRSMGVSSSNEAAEEARSIYNTASQEVTVLLRSSAELWNRTETIPSYNGTYRLRFAAGSHQNGTWDPGYFDFFRTPIVRLRTNYRLEDVYLYRLIPATPERSRALFLDYIQSANELQRALEQIALRTSGSTSSTSARRGHGTGSSL
jgi:hypothetical protein